MQRDPTGSIPVLDGSFLPYGSADNWHAPNRPGPAAGYSDDGFIFDDRDGPTADSGKWSDGSDPVECGRTCISNNPAIFDRTPSTGNSSTSAAFLRAMQEILAAIAFYALETSGLDAAAVENLPLPLPPAGRTAHDGAEMRKNHLLDLLQSLDERYAQFLHEIHTVSSAFNAVTELDARFALPTVSSAYKKLRQKISRQIGEDDRRIIPWAGARQPQRGLPEKSVAVLRAWMFQNFLHPSAPPPNHL